MILRLEESVSSDGDTFRFGVYCAARGTTLPEGDYTNTESNSGFVAKDDAGTPNYMRLYYDADASGNGYPIIADIGTSAP
jgi:hypothetical protein